VWFDEELAELEVSRIEHFLAGGPCDLVIVVGTTVSFDYVRDWIVRGAGVSGVVVDVNPDESQVTRQFQQRGWHVRERAGDALPAVVRALS